MPYQQPSVWSESRPSTPPTVRTFRPVATATSDVSNSELSEDSGTQGQCDTTSCSNTRLGQEARHGRIDSAEPQAESRVGHGAASRCLLIFDIIHMAWCFRHGTCQCKSYMSGFLLDLEDAREANDDQKLPKRLLTLLYQEAYRDSGRHLQDQKWFGKGLQGHYNHVSTRERLLVRSYPGLRRFLLARYVDHMLEIALSVTSTLYDPVLEYAHDDILEIELHDTLTKGTPTSYVNQLQQDDACMLLLKVFHWHHTSFSCLPIKNAIGIGVP